MNPINEMGWDIAQRIFTYSTYFSSSKKIKTLDDVQNAISKDFIKNQFIFVDPALKIFTLHIRWREIVNNEFDYVTE